MHEQQGMLCGTRDKKKTNQSRMITAAQRQHILVDFVRGTLVAAANWGSLLNIAGTFTCVWGCCVTSLYLESSKLATKLDNLLSNQNPQTRLLCLPLSTASIFLRASLALNFDLHHSLLEEPNLLALLHMYVSILDDINIQDLEKLIASCTSYCHKWVPVYRHTLCWIDSKLCTQGVFFTPRHFWSYCRLVFVCISSYFIARYCIL